MKKFNFLSFLLGVIAIGGISVFALSSQYLKSDGTPDFQKLKSISNGNKLNAQMRDSLMDRLSILQQQSNSIPAGAIMAFNLSACPAGWTRFAEADGRFIMGSSSNSREKGGQSSIKLTIDQLPPHNFQLNVNNYKGGDNANHRDFVKSREVGGAKYNTNTIGKGQPLNIQNPYIKLLYCQKGEYTPPRKIGSCQGTYYTYNETNNACYDVKEQRLGPPSNLGGSGPTRDVCIHKPQYTERETCERQGLERGRPHTEERDCSVRRERITNNCNTIKDSQSCEQQSGCSREEREA